MRSENGFTLVEVILAIGIFAIVAIPIVSMFLDGIKITSKSEHTTQVYALAQKYIEQLKAGKMKVENQSGTDLAYNYKCEYTIKVNSKSPVVESDGKDFYQYMNDTDSCKMILSNSNLKINSTIVSNFNNITINKDCDWVFDDTTVSVKKNNIWLQYGDLSSQKTLIIDNKSGKEINIYLQWTGSDSNKKDYLKIKNMGGIINVYGPITDIPQKRGRKMIANVTVTVRNSKTKEHAELTANVIYYE